MRLIVPEVVVLPPELLVEVVPAVPLEALLVLAAEVLAVPAVPDVVPDVVPEPVEVQAAKEMTTTMAQR